MSAVNRRQGRLVSVILGIAIAVVLLQQETPEAALSMALFLVVSLILATIVTWLVIAVHEIGHVVGGWFAGFRVRLLKIGSFTWWMSGGARKFHFNARQLDFTGFASMTWDESRSIERRYQWFILGGPLASSILFVALYFALPWRPLFNGSPKLFAEILANFLSFYAVCIAGYFLACTVIPMRIRGMNNDGRQFVLILRKKLSGEYLALASKQADQLTAGDRCRDWNLSRLERLIELSPGPLEEATYRHLRGLALIYRGQIDEGVADLELAYGTLEEPSVASVLRKGVALETAFARAYWKNEVTGAEAALSRAMMIDFPARYGFLRAESAIALAKGDQTKAVEKAEEAKAQIRKDYSALLPIHEGCLEEMDQLIARAAKSPTLS